MRSGTAAGSEGVQSNSATRLTKQITKENKMFTGKLINAECYILAKDSNKFILQILNQRYF